MLYRHILLEDRSDGSINAGAKAPADVSRILKSLDFLQLCLSGHLLTDVFRLFLTVLFKVRFGARMVLQYPSSFVGDGKLHRFISFLKVIKRLKITVLVHDLPTQRCEVNMSGARDVRGLAHLADVVIAQNPVMCRWLREQGLSTDVALVSLEIFDYLMPRERKDIPQREEGVNIIGGLAADKKTSYLRSLSDVSDVTWYLYGPNYCEDLINGRNVNYCGAFTPEEVPAKLKGRFSLVWDGESIDSSVGVFGEYLRLNNPHKLSAFVVAKTPILIWEEAAEAAFVVKEGIGKTIRSLVDIPSVIQLTSDEEYAKMTANLSAVSERLQEGYYTKKALREAEGLLCS